MPTWTVRLNGHRDSLLVTADRLEATPTTYTWWSVVVIIHEARWSCARRISTAEILSVEEL